MNKNDKEKGLLSIGEVAKIFGINRDTLRNWEDKGIITPLRIGPRGDRKYRPQDIEKISTDKSIVKSFDAPLTDDSGKMNLTQLKQFLWRSADILRGKIDSSDYKKYIFGLLFYKRISDSWDEEYKKVLEEYHDEEVARADHNHRFQVPKDCRWEVVQKQAEGIGHKLNEIFDKLTNANSPKLDKIFDDLDFANKDKFPNETLQRLINNFSQHNFGDNYISSDLLGDAYEYLIEQFAADAGKKGGEFYTPREVERVIINILKPHEKDHIYDMAVGSGGFLLEAYHHLKNESGEKKARSLYLYGQEVNIGTYAIAKINMFLHGLDSADIQRGDTLADPKFLNPDGSLKTFDICVANPPYSIKDWEYEIFKSDKYGRVDGYEMPPAKKADYAFVLHMVKSMNENGRAGIVLPHGALSHSGPESRIREQLIKNDLIEAIISLPEKLFYGTTISAAIIILNKNKPENHKNNILMIDAEKEFDSGKNQNRLRSRDIEKIVSTFDLYKDVERYSRVVSLDEVASKKFILKTKIYVNSDLEDEIIDIIDARTNLSESEDAYFKDIKKKREIFKIADTDKISHHNWKRVLLGDIAEIKNGKTNTQDAVIDGEYPLFDRSITVKKSNKFLYDKTAIILPGEGAEFFPRYFSGKFDLHQRAYAIFPNSLEIDPTFLYYFIYANRGYFSKNAVGSTVKSLRLPIIQSMPIFFPALSEQLKIAAIFSNIDDSLQKADNVTCNIKNLKKGLMQDLLNGNKRTI